MKPALLILLVDQKVAAWCLDPSAAPRRLPIQGQAQLGVCTAEALIGAYKDLAERLLDVPVDKIHWLVDHQGRTLCGEHWPRGDGFPVLTAWQLLAWEWLAERFGLSDTSPWNCPEFIESDLLPWLLIADDATERRQMQEALAREHRSASERLADQRLLLEEENQRLREQNSALRQVDAERLVSYLPALFPRVFTVLGAGDLALLCGKVEPLQIPNPFPEPSEEALHKLQRAFRALPRNYQRQIVGLVSEWLQRKQLKPRPEMRDLLDELEQN